MKYIILVLICFGSCLVQAQSLKGKHIFLYTKNGKGYVHDNIPNAVKSFDSLALKYKFSLTKSADPAIFTDAFLSKVDLIVFASTNNDVFDTDEQRLAFRHYIESGGNFFGIHSVLGTERNWTWFKQMMGGSFAWHPRFQLFDVVKMDERHKTVAALPKAWTRRDECYFLKELYPGVRPILAVDLNTLKADSTDQKKIELNKGTYLRYYPISWEHFYDGGHILITTLGHDKNDYFTSEFSDYLVANMKYLIETSLKKNRIKIHSKNRDDSAQGL